MEMLMAFFGSKLFVANVMIGTSFCLLAAIIIFISVPESARSFLSELNDAVTWCILSCLIVGIVFLWLPMLIAGAIFSVAGMLKLKKEGLTIS